MPIQRPLIIGSDGRIKRLPTGDTLPQISEGRPKTGATIHYGLPGVAIVNSGTRALVASRAYYSFIRVTSDITISEITCEVSTAAAATVVRMGIDTADTNEQSLTRVIDAGTIDSSTAGIKTITAAVTLTPGDYSLVVISNGTPTLRSIRGSVLGAGVLPTLGATPLAISFFVAGAGSALPAAGTQWTTTTGSTSPNDYLSFLTITVP